MDTNGTTLVKTVSAAGHHKHPQEKMPLIHRFTMIIVSPAVLQHFATFGRAKVLLELYRDVRVSELRGTRVRRHEGSIAL